MRLTANLTTVILSMALIASWSLLTHDQEESPDLAPRLVAFRAANYNLNHRAPGSAVETSWELGGGIYKADGREVSVSQVLDLRETVLASYDDSIDEETYVTRI